MKVGDTVLLIGAASDCSHLIGRQGVIVPKDTRSGSYFNVRVEGPHNHKEYGSTDTFLLSRTELRPLSALELLAGAETEWPDANT